MYEGMMLRNFYCPAVSHSCSLYSSCAPEHTFVEKSIPIVGFVINLVLHGYC